MLAVNASLVTAGVMIPPTHAFDYTGAPVLASLDETEVEDVRTGRAYLFPVTEPIGVSQGYYALHRGVDIRAPKGTPTVAVASGVVIEVREQAFGYGKHVRIAHAGTISSLYAHLDEIEVSVGDKVVKGQEIGQVGSTGWSTGSHLHFEIYEAQNTINPELVW